MNTYIWGPQMWRILHTVSFYPANLATASPDYDANVRLLLVSLQNILPCSFCRRSYVTFYNKLPSLSAPYPNADVVPSTTDGVRQFSNPSEQHFVHWVYQLHNMVNLKLNANCNIITLDCLRKRQVLHPQLCCSDDVWDIIIVLALNHDDRVKHEDKHAFAQYRLNIVVFIWTMCRLLAEHQSTTGLKLRAYCQQHPPFFNTSIEFRQWVVAAATAIGAPHVVDFDKYAVARSTKCVDKSCQ